jgi:hypothetical protein
MSDVYLDMRRVFGTCEKYNRRNEGGTQIMTISVLKCAEVWENKHRG